MPAVAVEIGFLSNPREEKLLQEAAYQKKVAKAIASGLAAYFAAKYRQERGRGEQAEKVDANLDRTREQLWKLRGALGPGGGAFILRKGWTTATTFWCLLCTTWECLKKASPQQSLRKR